MRVRRGCDKHVEVLAEGGSRGWKEGTIKTLADALQTTFAFSDLLRLCLPAAGYLGTFILRQRTCWAETPWDVRFADGLQQLQR